MINILIVYTMLNGSPTPVILGNFTSPTICQAVKRVVKHSFKKRPPAYEVISIQCVKVLMI